MAFAFDLTQLIAQIDASKWPAEVDLLKRVRSLAELEAMAQHGWISTGTKDPRLKLVRHGSGTFLVVRFEDGWSTRVAMQPMHR
jgi:hypothetical protein